MSVIKAECTLKKKLPNNVRFAEFQYKFLYYTDCKGSNFSHTSIDILTVDHELEVTWTIEYCNNFYRDNSNHCTWKKIKIKECSDKNIYGNYYIEGPDKKSDKGTFDTTHLPFEKDLSNCIKCYCGSESVLLTIQIYRVEEAVTLMIDDYISFLENGKPCDITFFLGDEEIPAHKAVVSARCKIFDTMLNLDMLEKNTGRIEIKDIELSVFKSLLSFLYRGQIDSNLDVDELIQLSLAADKYSVKNLASHCGYYISLSLSTENVVEALKIADLLKEKILKKDCMRFIIENKTEVVKTESYKDMVKSRSDLLDEIFQFA